MIECDWGSILFLFITRILDDSLNINGWSLLFVTDVDSLILLFSFQYVKLCASKLNACEIFDVGKKVAIPDITHQCAL